MKPIEEAFSSSGFRRVVLPGIVLTVGIHPLLSSIGRRWLSLYGIAETTVVLLAEVIFWGLIVSSTTNWVYYVYEGVNLPWLTRIARRSGEQRLASALADYDGILKGRPFSDLSPEEQQEAALTFETLLDYPLTLEGGQPTRFAERATVLGNIISSYELYAKSRYHVDGAYYWFHLLAFAPDSLVKEFDEKYGFAESLVLTSFAGIIVALVNAIVLTGLGFGRIWPAWVVGSVPISPSVSAALLLFGFIIFVIFYLLALPAHREAGKIFRCVVDLAIPALEKWSRETVAPLEAASQTRLAVRKRYLNSLKGTDTAAPPNSA